MYAIRLNTMKYIAPFPIVLCTIHPPEIIDTLCWKFNDTFTVYTYDVIKFVNYLLLNIIITN